MLSFLRNYCLIVFISDNYKKTKKQRIFIMKTYFKCEICGNSNWKIVGRKKYIKKDYNELNVYQKKRFRVLFEKWFPGFHEVEFIFKYCKKCGLLVYSPRPEKIDIEIKYRFIQELEKKPTRSRYNSEIKKKRSKTVYKYIDFHKSLKSIRTVLDYGGADGRLMQSFIDNGKHCFTVDYEKNCIPGAQKLCDTVYEIEKNHSFDLIVCSHVLEHVAEPRNVLENLIRNLNSNGLIYIEVPMELRGRLPFHKEPVTHINFFTPNSLANLLITQRLNILDCRLTESLHPSGKWKKCVMLLAQNRYKDIGRHLNCSINKFKKPDLKVYIKLSALGKLKNFVTKTMKMNN